jgi:hypothetical protein
MPQPKDHTTQRGAMESLLRQIPGFKGYLEREYRRDSDKLQRDWLADRLQRAKRSIDEVIVRLTDVGQLDVLPHCDRLRLRLDKLISSVRGAMRGYSGFFDLVEVNEAVLDRVYEHDVKVMEKVEQMAESVERLPADASALRPAIDKALAQLDALQQEWQRRADTLRGLE